MSDLALIAVAVIAGVVVLQVTQAKKDGAREAGYAAGQGAVDEVYTLIFGTPPSGAPSPRF